MTLDDLGFAQNEIFRARATRSGLMYLPATVNNHSTEVVFDTTSYHPLWVLRDYATQRPLCLKTEAHGSDVYSVENLSLLGFRANALEAPVQPMSGPSGSGFGNVGARLFGDAILALDPAGPRASLTHGRSIGYRTAPWAHLPLIEGPSGAVALIAVTPSAKTSTRPLTVLLSTIHSRSAIASSADLRIPRWGPLRRRGAPTREVDLVLDSREFRQECLIVDHIPGYPRHQHVPPIDLRLGWDFLCGFISVFDFAEHQVRLYSYATNW